MGKINRCLRLTFIIFNGIFAGIGCLMMYGAFKATIYSSQTGFGESNLVWGWVIAFGVLGISCLGVFAAKMEKLILLKVFAGFMGFSMALMLIFGIIVAGARHKVINVFSSHSDEVQEIIMDDYSMKAVLEELQLEGHCCGIWGPGDWENQIPDSCECNFRTEGLEVLGLARSECEAKPLGSTGPSRIYARPCTEVIQVILTLVFQVAMGFFFTLAVIAFFGLLISLLMIHQIKRHDEMGRGGIPMKDY